MSLIQILSDPASLSPNPWNSNVVSSDNEAKLDESVRRFGMFKPVICRELEDGTLQIIGGEHRAASAIRVGLKQIPVINLGALSDAKAKEISLVDNGRYGSDNALQLAEVLESLDVPVEELASFMPFTEDEVSSIFSSVNIALDDLGLTEEDERAPTLPTAKPVQTHQILRFKVPVEDAQEISELIERTAKVQHFVDGDQLSNAGDALVHLLLKKAA